MTKIHYYDTWNGKSKRDLKSEMNFLHSSIII